MDGQPAQLDARQLDGYSKISCASSFNDQFLRRRKSIENAGYSPAYLSLIPDATIPLELLESLIGDVSSSFIYFTLEWKKVNRSVTCIH